MNTLTNDNNSLYRLVCHCEHVNEFDAHLKILPNIDEVLMTLHQRDNQCVTLLILAALHGNDEIVRIILAHSSDVQQLVELAGDVRRKNQTLVKNATALWCACDRGHYTVARTLIELGGAKIEHGPRYPLLIDAIIAGRLDTVRFLVENHYAHLNNPKNDLNGKLNSLIMAVIYGHTAIVDFLLENGANFDYKTPTSYNTPLGYAAIKGHLDIVRLLCIAGACYSWKNKNGQTPLMLAARYNRMHVVDYLLDQTDNETGIKQLELVACSFILPLTNNNMVPFQKILSLLRKIIEIRTIRNQPELVASPIAAYIFHQECQTFEELDRIQHDNDRLCIEILIIRERLLVPKKDATLFKPLLVYGDKLIERGQFEHCLDLWEHTFYLYQNMNLETGLHRFVWLFCKMISSKVQISPQRFVQICRLTFEPSQQTPKDDYIKNAVCLLSIAVKVLEQSMLTIAERHLIYQWITDLCRQQRVTSSGQTLLHLSADAQTYHDINYRVNDIKPILIFPNLSVIQFLLTYCSQWIDINAVESVDGNTALHINCINNANNSLAVIQMLIHFGAHIDCVNRFNETPLAVTQLSDVKKYLKAKQLPRRLKCLCACFIAQNQLPYERIWSKEKEMYKFLLLHDSFAKQGEAN